MFDPLYKIGELIEQYYVCLINLEIAGERNSIEYKKYKKLLNDKINQESSILRKLSPADYQNLRIDILNKLGDSKFSPMSLGHLPNAYLYRLLFSVLSKLGEDTLEYEAFLRYDIGQLSCEFFSSLISDDNYLGFQIDFIYYKYNIIYMNELLEEDFLQERKGLKLISDSYRTADFLSYRFVDKTVLVLEAKQHIDYLASLDDEMMNDRNTVSMSILSLIAILSRLTLCDEFSLTLVEDDFQDLCESNETPFLIKNEIAYLLEILKNMKNSMTR